MTVVDSGTFIDLQLGEVTIDQLGTDGLSAPHLVDSEVVDGIRGLVLGGVVTQRAAEQMIRWFGQLIIERHPAQSLVWRVWELRNNLTAYDATYVALAEQLNTTLVTTDARIGRVPGIRCDVAVV